MDVEYDEKRFRDIEGSDASTDEEQTANVTIIPVSATEGDNVLANLQACHGIKVRRFFPIWKP